MEFIGNALLWTGALCLKRTIDVTVGLHGGIYRDGTYIPPPHDRNVLGFVYAGLMVLAALFAGLVIDWRTEHLLNKALKLAEEEASRPNNRESAVLSDATLWRMRYEFARRGGGMIQKCLAYTSASQTSTATVNALGSFPTEHYWMYAGISTAVGVVASILLANKCTLGGGITTSQVQRALKRKYTSNLPLLVSNVGHF